MMKSTFSGRHEAFTLLSVASPAILLALLRTIVDVKTTCTAFGIDRSDVRIGALRLVRRIKIAEWTIPTYLWIVAKFPRKNRIARLGGMSLHHCIIQSIPRCPQLGDCRFHESLEAMRFQVPFRFDHEMYYFRIDAERCNLPKKCGA